MTHPHAELITLLKGDGFKLSKAAAAALEKMAGELANLQTAARMEINGLIAERDTLRAAFDDRVRVIELQLQDKEVMRAEVAALAKDANRMGHALACIAGGHWRGDVQEYAACAITDAALSITEEPGP